MADAVLTAQIEGAKAYEALFVPALFSQWAPRTADAAQIRLGQRVLDVACGTGVVAREAAARVGPGGRVVGLDPNPGMLAVARDLAPSVEWREGVAESLPFPDGSFDAVVSQFGLMFFTDREKALREMTRVLVPGGRLAVAVWDSLESMPAYTAAVGLLERTAGRPAADALRAPFVLGDRTALEGLLQQAAVAGARIATQKGTARFPNIRTMVEADLRGWLPMVGVALDEQKITEVLAAAERVLRPFAEVDGRMTFALSAHLVTATKG